MKTILQRTTTITVSGAKSVVQPQAGHADLKDCNVVTVFAQVYGMTSSNGTPRVELMLQNSPTGDHWTDALAEAVPYGVHQFVLKYDATEQPPLLGPLFRWKVTGTTATGSPVSSISFRILLAGEKVD
jgi:hypothetical protein